VKTIEQMLQYLVRPEATEFAIVSDCLPCVSVRGKFRPIDKVPTNSDQILEMLVACGGSRYVDSLSARPTSWTARIDRIGTISVKAVLRDEVVQARIKLIKLDPRAVPPPIKTRQDDPDDAPTVQTRAPQPPARPDGGVPFGAAPAAPESDDTLAGTEFELDPPSSKPAQRSGAAEVDLGEPDFPQPVTDFDLESFQDLARTVKRVSMGHEQLKAAMDASQPSMPAATPVSTSAWPPKAPEPLPATIAGLLERARQVHASDLHLVPERPVLMRIAGDLLPGGDPIDEAYARQIADSIVPERLRDILDVEGSCDFALADESGRARVNVSRQRTGTKICVRLIRSEIPTLESLGLPPEIERATHHHQGLIVVTGPTGHGKTTTLAAIVNLINSETTHHVITVEDPIEYLHPRKKAMLSQREVGTSTRSFQAALKGSLREDPDVIVVGELRDTETVRMALSASETGHLVIGTMNTPSAAKTIDRLIDLFPPGDQAQVRMTLAGGLRLIVSQRLIPNADRSDFVVAAELLPGSVSLWSLIRDDKTFQIPSLQQRGKGIGIIRIDDSLCDLVKSGKTTLEIAKEWAENPQELELNALGKRPQMAPPMQPRPAGEGAKEAMTGLLGKAGNLFRKGG
jgi:twitching motility protein PilT